MIKRLNENRNLKMADIHASDLKIDLPNVLESVLEIAESILQNVDDQIQVDTNTCRGVVDQSISLIRALQNTSDVQPSDMMALDALAGDFTNGLALNGITSLPAQ